MVPGVQQRKSDQRRDLHPHEGYVQRLKSRTAQLGIDYSHGESLVKVHVAYITTTSCGVRETNLGIQIRSVEVDLSTICVDNIARLLDAVLEHTISGWVCDLRNKVRPGTRAVSRKNVHHKSCEVVLVLLCLCTKVCDVEATVRQALHRDHL